MSVVCTEEAAKAYLVVHSAANAAGCYGMSLWISLRKPWVRVGGQNFFVQPDMVVPLVLEPRVLIARVASQHFASLIVVAHGPYDSGSPDAAEIALVFWSFLQVAISHARSRNEGLLLFVDANAQLYGGPAVADFAIPFRQFVDHLELFDLGQEGTGTDGQAHHVTYQVSVGAGHQLDYVLASSDFIGEAGCPSAAASFVPSVDCLDHLPHAVAAHIVPTRRRHVASRRSTRHCRADVLAKSDAVGKALAQIPVASAQLDNSSRVLVTNERVLRVLSAVCPPRQNDTPRKPYVSFATFSIARHAAWLGKRALSLGRLMKQVASRPLEEVDTTKLVVERASLMACIKCARRRIKLGIIGDLADYASLHVDQLVEAAGDGSRPSNSTRLFAVAKWFGPCRSRSRLLVADSAGTPAGSRSEEAANIRAHYQAIGCSS